ncbi:MAG TPA: CAP domain-containing protein [Polyangia bacterium]|nr:CAP domain-containing protein [Polyangia bacterium]
MRMFRFALAALVLAGCLGETDRHRRTAGPADTGGTGGSPTAGEPDGAAGEGGEGGQGGTAGSDEVDASATGGSMMKDSGSARDVAAPSETAPRDAAGAEARPADARPADARPDAPRDTSAPADAAADAPPSSDGPAGGDPEPGRLAGITRFHNQVRAGIPVPPLTWDPSVAATAAAYATECMFEHSGTKGVGENLAAYSGSGEKASAPVDDWAGEAADYDYASNSCAQGKTCGHYTQLVWKTSQRLGCAVQACSQNSPFGSRFPNWELWICQYAPPGNFVGQRPY